MDVEEDGKLLFVHKFNKSDILCMNAIFLCRELQTQVNFKISRAGKNIEQFSEVCGSSKVIKNLTLVLRQKNENNRMEKIANLGVFSPAIAG